MKPSKWKFLIAVFEYTLLAIICVYPQILILAFMGCLVLAGVANLLYVIVYRFLLLFYKERPAEMVHE